MHHQLGVTIVSDLSANDVRGSDAFPHVHVIDLRSDRDGRARPFEEETWRRLRSYFIEYDQLPVNLENPIPRQENALLQRITEQGGNVLIVTGQVISMAQFCVDFDLPFFNRDLTVFGLNGGAKPFRRASQRNDAVRPAAEPLDCLAG